MYTFLCPESVNVRLMPHRAVSDFFQIGYVEYFHRIFSVLLNMKPQNLHGFMYEKNSVSDIWG